jgi:hypothetical protein
MGIHLDVSGKHAAKITNRYDSLLAGFPDLCESLCTFVRFCDLMASSKITERRCQTKICHQNQIRANGPPRSFVNGGMTGIGATEG